LTQLNDGADLATHPGFIRRVTMAIVQAAVAIGNEPYDGTQYRIMRRALATEVQKEPEQWGKRLAWDVAANPAVAFDSPDDAIQYTITTFWDAVAGAYQSQPSP
jgi:hypothetical protein